MRRTLLGKLRVQRLVLPVDAREVLLQRLQVRHCLHADLRVLLLLRLQLVLQRADLLVQHLVACCRRARAQLLLQLLVRALQLVDLCCQRGNLLLVALLLLLHNALVHRDLLHKAVDHLLALLHALPLALQLLLCRHALFLVVLVLLIVVARVVCAVCVAVVVIVVIVV